MSRSPGLPPGARCYQRETNGHFSCDDDEISIEIQALGLDQEKGWLSKPGWKGREWLQLRGKMGDITSKGHVLTSISHMPSFPSSFLCFSPSLLHISSPIHPPLSTSSSDLYCPKLYGGLLALIVQFSSVQSLSHVRLFATPWTAARQVSLSITNSRSTNSRNYLFLELLKSLSIKACWPGKSHGWRSLVGCSLWGR